MSDQLTRTAFDGIEMQCCECRQWKLRNKTYFKIHHASKTILTDTCRECFNNRKLAQALHDEWWFGRKGYIYFVFVPAHQVTRYKRRKHAIKLGFTANLHERMAWWRLYLHNDVTRLLGIMDGDMFLEKYLKRMFHSQGAKRTEWKHITDDLLDYIEANTTLPDRANIEMMTVDELKQIIAQKEQAA